MRKISVFVAFLLLCSLTFFSCKKKDTKKSYTLIAAPANNPTEVHIWGNSDQNQSGVGAPEIGAAAWTANLETVYMRAALKFDLSSIPADATITSAKLTLYSNHTPLNGDQSNANSGSDNTMLIQQIASPWAPASVAWANQPAAGTQNEIIIPSTTVPFLDLADVDVSALIKNMLGANNNGFLIRLQTEEIYNCRIFCSSKYSAASKFPKLVVVYSH